MTGICNYSSVVHLKNGLSNACFVRFDESDGGKRAALEMVRYIFCSSSSEEGKRKSGKFAK